MTFRQVVRPGEQDETRPHEHDATDISGTFNFLRILRGVIDGDLTLRGFFRTADSDSGVNRIEIRPSTSSLVASLTFFTGEEFSQNEGFIETEDEGSGTWALKIASPVEATDFAVVTLRSDGILGISVTEHVTLDNQLRIADGSAAAPAIRKTAAADGIFFDTGAVALSINGQEVGRFTDTGLELSVPIIVPDGTAANPSITFGDSGAGFFYDSDDNAIGVAV